MGHTIGAHTIEQAAIHHARLHKANSARPMKAIDHQHRNARAIIGTNASGEKANVQAIASNALAIKS